MSIGKVVFQTYSENKLIELKYIKYLHDSGKKKKLNFWGILCGRVYPIAPPHDLPFCYIYSSMFSGLDVNFKPPLFFMGDSCKRDKTWTTNSWRADLNTRIKYRLLYVYNVKFIFFQACEYYSNIPNKFGWVAQGGGGLLG